MIRTRSISGICATSLFGLGLLSVAAPLTASQSSQATGRITKYDIATRDDLLFSRLVAPVMSGEISDWSKQLLGGMPAQFGDWISQFIDATALANIVTETFPVEGQPALKPVDKLVDECARTLEVDKPEVYVRNSPQTRDLHGQVWRPISPRSHQWAAQPIRRQTGRIEVRGRP